MTKGTKMTNVPGNQTKYYYKLSSGETIYQYCRSEAEAESWAETYSRSVFLADKVISLVTWGAKS
jgi:hypothetical protein